MDAVKKAMQSLSGWKYVLLVAAVGLALLLLPGGGQTEETSAAAEELRLEALLGSIEGVGEVRVLLSEHGAAVVCQGADDAAVRLSICRVLHCYTALGTDDIQVFKMN